MKIEGFDWYFRLKKVRLLIGFAVTLVMMSVVVVIAGDHIKGVPVTAQGLVVSKTHKDAHRTSTGKHRSEKWTVKVKGDKASGSCNVTKVLYDSLQEGEAVEISAIKGGVTGIMYIRSVKKADPALAASTPLDGPQPAAK